MNKKKGRSIVISLFFIISYFFSVNAYSYVGCSEVKVSSLKTASNPIATGLNNNRIVGSVVYIDVPIKYCSARNGEDISGGIYMLLNDIGNKESSSYGIKAFWRSLLLVSAFNNGHIDFHASSIGKAEDGFLLVVPYFIREI